MNGVLLPYKVHLVIRCSVRSVFSTALGAFEFEKAGFTTVLGAFEFKWAGFYYRTRCIWI